MQFGFPDMQISGVGVVDNPRMPDEQFREIINRADKIEDASIRNDMFALIAELEHMRR